MSTRSNIAVKVIDTKYYDDKEIGQEWPYIYVYCHFDGYPSHHLPILNTYYNDLDKAIELVKHGDISILAESCENPEGHSFDTPVKGYTIYYGRDRDEKNVKMRRNISVRSMLQEQWLYVFENGKWECYGSNK